MTDDERARTAQASPADDEAAARAHAAAAAAFAKLIGLYHDDMARVAFVVSGDAELAGEAAQGAWPQAWKERQTPRSPDRLRAWLLGLSAKEAKWLTEAGSRARAEAGRGDTGVVPATQAAAAGAYRSDELELANAFATLDAHDRQIVALRYVAGLSSDDIGRELGMPGGAVQARVARILKMLLASVRTLEAPTDQIDAYELALAQKIRAFSSRAVVPLDSEAIAAVSIAQAAADIGIGTRLAQGFGGLLERLQSTNRAVLAAAGGLVAVVFAVLIVGGGGTSAAPIATPFPTDATRLCEPHELVLRVTKWEVAGSDRLGTVEMQNVTAGACLVDDLPEPWLVQAPQLPILVGNDTVGTLIRIGPSDVLRSVVRVRNYCGPVPKAPVTLAFRRATTVFLAQALTTTDLSGVPPCGGYAGSKSDIQMEPWRF